METTHAVVTSSQKKNIDILNNYINLQTQTFFEYDQFVNLKLNIIAMAMKTNIRLYIT